ncbi:MAG: DUF937 domain-containing protein [Wenzhouxiangella sp.]
MDKLLSLLSSTLDDRAVGDISQQINASPEQTRGAINAALPMLMGMMANNCQSKQGCESLAQAINQDHAGGGLLDQAQSFFKQGNIGSGEGILRNILGNRQNTAEQQLASQTGLQTGQVHTLLAMLAPILMGALGRQAQSQGGANAGNLQALIQGSLGGLMQGQGGQLGGQLLGQLLGGQSAQSGSQGGLAAAGGKLLGGLFKK